MSSDALTLSLLRLKKGNWRLSSLIVFLTDGQGNGETTGTAFLLC